MEEFERAELAKFDGKNGRPAYVAFNGKIYDVSSSKHWREGWHMKRHQAGQDLTPDLQVAPHEADVLEKFPQVGTLKEEVEEVDIPQALAWLLAKVPMLRRHPHPMTVHFPIVFMFSTTVFNILYLVSGVKSFEITALHCLGAGILFTAIAIATGLYTWWLNYMSSPLRPVKIKIPLTLVLLVIEIIIFIWRIIIPDVLDFTRRSSIIYLLLVFSLLPMVTVIGWFGASMTFPVEKD